MIDATHSRRAAAGLPGVGALHPVARPGAGGMAGPRPLQREMLAGGRHRRAGDGLASTPRTRPTRSGVAGTLGRGPPSLPGLHAVGVMDPRPAAEDRDHLRRAERGRDGGGACGALKGYLGYLHYGPEHAGYRPLLRAGRAPTACRSFSTRAIPILRKAKLRYAHPLLVDRGGGWDHPGRQLRAGPRRQSLADRCGGGRVQVTSTSGPTCPGWRSAIRPTSPPRKSRRTLQEARNVAAAGPSATPSGPTASSTAATGHWRRWPRIAPSSRAANSGDLSSAGVRGQTPRSLFSAVTLCGGRPMGMDHTVKFAGAAACVDRGREISWRAAASRCRWRNDRRPARPSPDEEPPEPWSEAARGRPPPAW